MSIALDRRDETSAVPRPRLGLVSEGKVAGLLLGALVLFLLVAVALPLWALLSKSFEDGAGRFVGLANYVRYFATPTLVQSLFNSLAVALVATAIVVPLAFGYAYALTRTCMRFKGLFYALVMLPVFAPSLLSAISFIYIFGNQGFLRAWLMGASVYGPIGIVMAQVFYCMPHAAMILVTALSLADGRLYEAAAALGTSRARVFRTVTLPGARYGLISAAFVVFTLVVTDFGIPKVIGGQFGVLATDAYKQVVGQQNFQMGAVVGMILLVPAVLAFAADRLVQKKQVSLLSARAVPYQPRPRAGRDLAATVFCAVVGGLIAAVLGVAVWASFIQYWPYNLSLTLGNYDFPEFDPSGWSPYLTSLQLAFAASVIGSALVFLGAYLIEKLKVAPALRGFAQFLAMLPMAVPGLVLGLGYVFFFNARWNPLGFLYGTLGILALNTVGHFYTVAHVTAVTALKQIDGEFEAVSASLKVPFWTTLRRVTLPICLPAILDVAVYLFVNALTTVSAVIFLYGPSTKLASIAIVHMDEAGSTAAAAAMATCVVATAIAVKAVHLLLDRLVLARLQRWRVR
ncbi:putative 2-aminoethylphosphonate ABC transporter permease subunit [Alsobacter soli]|uniref:Putative 2-aminoethylphosphonate ABC transporter permease subunit n=1 Tax=Alsobacter soli TaxID=2109933 RepID=A0A2T1HPP1_9HYPH|nr:putative 2-aminoethylphosphonate ABC transporter permease subunit [Alsobacter soli]PSC03621.1 putative 2-aminoethylphosphonate ABC transporter permease subunit [Alsobacter soli]